MEFQKLKPTRIRKFKPNPGPAKIGLPIRFRKFEPVRRVQILKLRQKLKPDPDPKLKTGPGSKRSGLIPYLHPPPLHVFFHEIFFRLTNFLTDTTTFLTFPHPLFFHQNHTTVTRFLAENRGDRQISNLMGGS